MIRPHGKYLLVKLIDPPKKKGLILMQEEEDPIARCELIDCGREVGDWIEEDDDLFTLFFRRYELRDCIDKEQKIYLIKEECLLGYDNGLDEIDEV